MSEIQWTNFMEVFVHSHADLIASYLRAHGIETQIIQEAYYEYQLGAADGFAQILVPNFQLDEAKKLYAESGWNFDITKTNEDEESKEEDQT